MSKLRTQMPLTHGVVLGALVAAALCIAGCACTSENDPTLRGDGGVLRIVHDNREQFRGRPSLEEWSDQWAWKLSNVRTPRCPISEQWNEATDSWSRYPEQ